MTTTTTAQTATWISPPATALGETDIAGDQVVYATSADLEWTYGRVGRGTWRVTHELTGLEMLFTGLPAARQWTADGDQWTADLRIVATELCDADFVLGTERNLGRRALMLLADPPTLLHGGTEPAAICICGGYLTAADAVGVRQHIDTCAEELHEPDERCPDDRNSHRVCDKPTPVMCGHCGRRPSDLTATPCLGTGRSRHARDDASTGTPDACCGCCHGNDQS